MGKVSFSIGTSARYQEITTKDTDTLYFLTDTLQVFKGNSEYTKSCKLVTSLPNTSEGIQGIIYINTSDYTLHVFNGTSFVQITKGYATSISATPTNNDVPTTKAVADYVTNKIADVVGGVGTFVTDVTYYADTGSLSVAKGADPVITTLAGVVNRPTYDSSTRKITLPVFGGDALVIELGKDAFVERGSYNSDTKTIDLVLTSGDEVIIPVGSLVDIYTGVATASTTVTVSSDNKISVDVKLSAKANNQIIIESDGLYVPLPDAYTKSQTDEKIKTVSDALNLHTGDTDIHVTASQKTEWSSKASTTYVDNAKTDAINTAATDATSKADQALSDAKKYTDSALEWKTI